MSDLWFRVTGVVFKVEGLRFGVRSFGVWPFPKRATTGMDGAT